MRIRREVDPPTTTEFVEPIALSNDGHVLISGHGEPQISGTAVPFVWRGPGDIEEIEIPEDYAYFWQEPTKPGCLWTGDRVVLTVRRLDTAKRRPLLIDGSSVTEILVADDATELLLTHCSDRGSYVTGRSDDFGDAWRWHEGRTTFLYQDGLVGSPLGVNRHGEVCAPPGCYADGELVPWPDWQWGVLAGPSADGFVSGRASEGSSTWRARWQIGSDTFEVIDSPVEGDDETYEPILIAPNGDVIIDDEHAEQRFYLWRGGRHSPLVAGDLEITQVVAFNDEGDILVRTTDFAAILHPEP